MRTPAPHKPPPLKRRQFTSLFVGGMMGGSLGVLSGSVGCVPSSGVDAVPDHVWGRRGLSDGRLMKPRAMTIDASDRLYIVDITGRVQVFDTEGNYLRHWRTPFIKQGRPTGLGIAQDGSVMVADTHYYRVLFYTPKGELQETRTIGGEHGDEPGKFHFVTDVAQAPDGRFFIGQYGQIDRIQEFSPEGELIRIWGNQGTGDDEFSRPQALEFDSQGLLWVADAANHRLKVFDVSASEVQLVDMWGSGGSKIGQMQYPYGIAFDQNGTLLVAEYGNHRVQRFDRQGKSLEVWGQAGKAPGQLQNPWALVVDSKRNLHVLDTMNHRLQRFRLA